MKFKLSVDDEFKRIAPPMSRSEYEELEKSIMITDEESKEQEGFLPAANHHICPFKRHIWAPISVFLLISPSK